LNKQSSKSQQRSRYEVKFYPILRTNIAEIMELKNYYITIVIDCMYVGQNIGSFRVPKQRYAL